MSIFPIASDRGRKMMSYLPKYYETSRVMGSVLQAEGTEFDNLREALDSTLDQFFARTATWSLDVWERELGLTPAPAQPIGERRDKVVSRLRGTGTATIRVVKEVAEAYDLGSIDVIEEFTTYTIWIRFVDTLGAPPNLSDLKGAVRAVLPAHLLVEYSFKYFLVGHIHQTITIMDLQSRKMTDFAPFIPM